MGNANVVFSPSTAWAGLDPDRLSVVEPPDVNVYVSLPVSVLLPTTMASPPPRAAVMAVWMAVAMEDSVVYTPSGMVTLVLPAE